MWREFQVSGEFSIFTAQRIRVPEPFTGSPLELTRGNPPQMRSFSGDSAAANRTAAAWKIFISLCDFTLAAESGETPPEEMGIVIFWFNN